MKQSVWVYTISFNEQHFVKHFLYAYKDAERIIVNDNMSTDDTRKLLSEDSRVEIRDYDSGGKIRDDMYLDFKNNAWKEARGKADWVIIVDFDEIFTRARLIDGEPVFDLNLEIPYNNGFNIIRPYGYNMNSLDAPLGADGHPFDYSKLGAYHVPQEKMCCFRPDKLKEIRFKAGCHLADPLDMNGTTDTIRIFISKDYKLLHYKFWNLTLYMERMAEYQRRVSDINKEFGWAWHYMEPMESHRNVFVRGHDHCEYLFDIKSPHE